MNLDDRLLKIKEITPLQKLIIGLILDTSFAVLNFEEQYSSTCGDIAKELGTTRTKVLQAVNSLIEKGYMTCNVDDGSRITNLTDKFLQLIFPLVELVTEPMPSDIFDLDEIEEDLSFLD